MLENQLSRYGAIAKALPFTPGKVFFVFKSDDAQLANFQHEFPVDKDGVQRVYTSLSSAYDATTDDNNDVIVLMGDGAHALTAMLSITKDRVHFVGQEWLLGIHKRYGQSSRITMGVTTDTDDVAMIQNTGVRNSFRGIKFDCGNTLTECVSTFGEGGEYTYFENCEFYNSTHLGVSAATELLLNGDSSQFRDCTFGDLVNTVTDNYIRACVNADRENITGKVARDCEFINCLFLRKAGGTEAAMVYIPNATDIERRLIFDRCGFINAKLAAADPAVAFSVTSAQTEGEVYCIDCWCAGCTGLATNSVGVYQTRPAAAAAGAEVVAAHTS